MLTKHKQQIYSGPIITASTFDYVPDGVLMQDIHGNISYVNPKLCSLTGYSRDELTGISHRAAAELLLDLDSIDFNEIRKTFFEVLKGKSFSTRRKLKHKTGSYVPVQQYLNPVTNEKGEIVGSMFLFRDLHHELLFEIGHAVNSSLNIEKIINSAIAAVLEHSSLSSSSIYLYNRETRELQLMACNVLRKEEMKKCTYKLGQGAPGIIAAELRPLYIRDLKTDPLIHQKCQKPIDSKSGIGFPLVSKGELLGVMAFHAHTVRFFTPQELFIFESIANQLAMAIHNARLYNITKKLSITDGLTDLYNHKYFQKRLGEELKRADRSGKPLCLLMLDMDNFKKVNDHFGHPYGDKALKKISEILKKSTRSSDIICRYGGEEFAIILTDCPKKNAVRLAEKIRAAIESLDIGIADVFKMTASIGVAAYPEQAADKKQLVEGADNALYKAKKYKNKVCLNKE